MERYAVIVAGGKGARMGTALPKQFLPIGGEPILMRTIRRFLRYDDRMHIMLVLPREQRKIWAELCERHGFREGVTVIDGGESRLQSVENGLSGVPDGVIVGIHDGVRPFVSSETLARCYAEAEERGSAVPVIPPVDSLREEDGTGSHAVDRSRYHLVQTPQVFRSSELKRAYAKVLALPESERRQFTDDASVYEKAGGKVNLVEGNVENIKITTPIDLSVAEVLVKKDP